MSYVNLIMYGAVLPSYKKPNSSEGGKKDEEIVRADDPKNRERVWKFLDSIE